MSGLLDGVNLRTQLVGHNRLELLLFFLDGEQRYGINVFKVHEVIQRPTLTRIPNAPAVVRGMATLRGKTIPVLDLGMALGQAPISKDGAGIVIVTEYNRTVQGFLVRAVDRIVNINWEKVVPPPDGTGDDHFLTAIAHVEKEMIEMIDVEKVLSNVGGAEIEISENTLHSIINTRPAQHIVLVADDSAVARGQIKRTLDRVGVQTILAKDGKEAYQLLTSWVEKNDTILNKLLMVISDIEMPEMDGYTLTSKIRSNERIKNTYVMLHTSLSGLFNHNLIRKVDANAFVPKFDANDLAQAVIERIKMKESEAPGIQ